MTYWFTVANTDQRKPFHQIYICSKIMQQISLKGHHLTMVFRESMVLNPFIKYSGYCKKILLNATSHDTSVEYAKKEHYRLVPLIDAKALKSVILKRKWHPKGENSVLSQKYLFKFIIWIPYSIFTQLILYLCIKYSIHTRDKEYKGRILKHHFCLDLSKNQTFVT